MPTTYTLADDDVNKAVDSMIRKYHAELADIDVKVGVLLAHNEESPAVKAGGYPGDSDDSCRPAKGPSYEGLRRRNADRRPRGIDHAARAFERPDRP